jgi:glycosyltransferase involved in cell wall biosynthesis
VFHFNGLFTLRKGLGVLVEAWLAHQFIPRWWLSVHNLLPHDGDTPLHRRIFAWVYRWPDRLVVHTEAMKAALQAEFGVDPDRILVIEHGIDQFHPPAPGDSEALCHRLGLPADGSRLLLMFGHLSPYKGADVLLQSVVRAGCRRASACCWWDASARRTTGPAWRRLARPWERPPTGCI